MLVRDYTELKFPSKIVTVDKNGQVLSDSFDYSKWMNGNELALKDAESPAGMWVRFLASMSGVLVNRRVYPGAEWRDAAPHFAQRPLLINHDDNCDPLGRMHKGEFESIKEGAAFSEDYKHPVIQEKGKKTRPSGIVYTEGLIHKPEAIERVMDKRYLTVSQGSRAEHAYCSICNKDWHDGWCEHDPGSWYNAKGEKVGAADKGAKLAFLIIRGMTPVELSIVADPALREAMILEYGDPKTGKKNKDFDEARASALKNADSCFVQESFSDFALVDSAGSETLIRFITEPVADITSKHPQQEPADNNGGSSAKEPDMELKDAINEINGLKDKAREDASKIASLEADKKKLSDEAVANKAALEAANKLAAETKASLDKTNADLATLQKAHQDQVKENHKHLVDEYIGLVKADRAVGVEEEKKLRESMAAKPLDIVKAIVEDRKATLDPARTTVDSKVGADNGGTTKPTKKDAPKAKPAKVIA